MFFGNMSMLHKWNAMKVRTALNPAFHLSTHRRQVAANAPSLDSQSSR
jgi:hypothetical protein